MVGNRGIEGKWHRSFLENKIRFSVYVWECNVQLLILLDMFQNERANSTEFNKEQNILSLT